MHHINIVASADKMRENSRLQHMDTLTLLAPIKSGYTIDVMQPM